MMRQAVPAASSCGEVSPAGISPATGRGVPGVTSVKRTAKPSMAELVKGGTASRASISRASTAPKQSRAGRPGEENPFSGCVSAVPMAPEDERDPASVGCAEGSSPSSGSVSGARGAASASTSVRCSLTVSGSWPVSGSLAAGGPSTVSGSWPANGSLALKDSPPARGPWSGAELPGEVLMVCLPSHHGGQSCRARRICRVCRICRPNYQTHRGQRRRSARCSGCAPRPPRVRARSRARPPR